MDGMVIVAVIGGPMDGRELERPANGIFPHIAFKNDDVYWIYEMVERSEEIWWSTDEEGEDFFEPRIVYEYLGRRTAKDLKAEAINSEGDHYLSFEFED